jgi:hypothetical protein
MRFTITQTRPDNPCAVVLDIQFVGANVREQALLISRLFPDELVAVSAMCRHRLQIKNGVVVRDFPNIEEFYDIGHHSANVQAYLRHEWTSLIATEFDPIDERRKL